MRERLLSFRAECFVFQFTIQKFKDYKIFRNIILLLFCKGVKLGLSH
jgi:hypothetical protein